MIPGLDELDKFNSSAPNPTETAMYLFLTFGISYVEFKQLPIPYILSMLKTHNYVKEQEEKEMKKLQRKR